MHATFLVLIPKKGGARGRGAGAAAEDLRDFKPISSVSSLDKLLVKC